MMYWDDGGSWFNWFWMIFMMLLVWGGVIAVIVYVVRGGPHHHLPPTGPPHGDSERTLAERFARGEIDETEYKQRRAVLRGQE